MGKFNLDPGETEIGNWTLLYVPPGGGKYNGKLVVTNKRLLYDAKFDMSVKGIVEEALLIKSGSDGYIQIPKECIKNVEVKKSFISKKVILTLDNGDIHTFDYGMLGIDKVAEAIKQK
jgi:hypothetical protein